MVEAGDFVQFQLLPWCSEVEPLHNLNQEELIEQSKILRETGSRSDQDGVDKTLLEPFSHYSPCVSFFAETCLDEMSGFVN